MNSRKMIGALALVAVAGTAYGDDAAAQVYRLRLRSDFKGKSANVEKDYVVRGPLTVEFSKSYPGVGSVPLSFAINHDEAIDLGKFRKISVSPTLLGKNMMLYQEAPAELVMVDGTVIHTQPNKLPGFCGYLGRPYLQCAPGLLRFGEGSLPAGAGVQDLIELEVIDPARGNAALAAAFKQRTEEEAAELSAQQQGAAARDSATTLWRKRLQPGDATQCGMAVEVKPPIASIQFASGVRWVRIDQLTEPGQKPCYVQ